MPAAALHNTMACTHELGLMVVRCIHLPSTSLHHVCLYAGKPESSKEEHKQGLISVWEDKELEEGVCPTFCITSWSKRHSSMLQ
jgi:hypothetical protein